MLNPCANLYLKKFIKVSLFSIFFILFGNFWYFLNFENLSFQILSTIANTNLKKFKDPYFKFNYRLPTTDTNLQWPNFERTVEYTFKIPRFKFSFTKTPQKKNYKLTNPQTTIFLDLLPKIMALTKPTKIGTPLPIPNLQKLKNSQKNITKLLQSLKQYLINRNLQFLPISVSLNTSFKCYLFESDSVEFYNLKKFAKSFEYIKLGLQRPKHTSHIVEDTRSVVTLTSHNVQFEEESTSPSLVPIRLLQTTWPNLKHQALLSENSLVQELSEVTQDQYQASTFTNLYSNTTVVEVKCNFSNSSPTDPQPVFSDSELTASFFIVETATRAVPTAVQAPHYHVEVSYRACNARCN